MPADFLSVGNLDFGDYADRDGIVEHEIGAMSPAPSIRESDQFRRFRCADEVPIRPDLRFRDPEPLFVNITFATVARADQKILELLMANLIDAHRRAPGTAVFYSRDRNHYSRSNLPDRYVPACYTYRSMMRAVAYLEAHALIHHHPTAASAYARHRSRIHATEKLVAFVGEMDVMSYPKELIILKDTEGRPRTYSDGRDVVRMRCDVRDQNEILETIDLMISPACDVRDKLGRFYRDIFLPGSLYRPLRRIFNGHWTRGGRWYGPPWQNLPKRVREHLLIDGERMVEVDFKTCHPRLLCAWTGIDLPFHDPDFDYYSLLPGLPRSDVKRAFNILINAPDDRAAIMALAQSLGVPIAYASYLIDEVRHDLPGLQRALRPGTGLSLQNRDAQICACVQRALRRRGIPVLSVHDSFLVARPHADLLQQVMDDEMAVVCRRLRG